MTVDAVAVQLITRARPCTHIHTHTHNVHALMSVHGANLHTHTPARHKISEGQFFVLHQQIMAAAAYPMMKSLLMSSTVKA